MDLLSQLNLKLHLDLTQSVADDEPPKLKAVGQTHDKMCPNYDIESVLASKQLTLLIPKSRLFTVEHSEGVDWANSIVRVLFEAWRTKENQFKTLVLEEIRIALNEDREDFLTEIIPTKMDLEGSPPQLLMARQCTPEEYASAGLDFKRDFYLEADIDFPGCFGLDVSLGVILNWPYPSMIEIQVVLKITVSQLRGRLRLCFSNVEQSFL